MVRVLAVCKEIQKRLPILWKINDLSRQLSSICNNLSMINIPVISRSCYFHHVWTLWKYSMYTYSNLHKLLDEKLSTIFYLSCHKNPIWINLFLFKCFLKVTVLYKGLNVFNVLFVLAGLLGLQGLLSRHTTDLEFA